LTRIPRNAAQRLIRDVVEAVDNIREIAGMGMDRFMRSRMARFSLRYSIVVAVEASADLAVMILEKDYGVRASSYREAFKLMAERGVIAPETYEGMARLVGLRNLVVHRYWEG